MAGLNAWIKQNVGVLILIATLSAGILSTWNKFSQAAEQTWRTAAEFQEHKFDSTRHIDPARDEQRMREIIRRIDELERKLDQLILQSR